MQLVELVLINEKLGSMLGLKAWKIGEIGINNQS